MSFKYKEKGCLKSSRMKLLWLERRNSKQFDFKLSKSNWKSKLKLDTNGSEQFQHILVKKKVKNTSSKHLLKILKAYFKSR